MSATVTIRRYTGAGAGTTNDITSSPTRASVSDNPSPGASAQLVVPSSGVVRSFWVSTRLNVDAGLTGTINAVKWNSTGAPSGLPSGCTYKGSDAGVPPNGGYRQATGTATSGDALSGHTGLNSAPVDVFLALGPTAPRALAGSLSATTGPVGAFFVYQAELAAGASPGSSGTSTFTFAYDETS